ncbi:MAG TPA: hypothetical protein VIX20_16470 [Ktedonobacteraceae bacterium]
MVGRIYGKVWIWSLIVACTLTGIFYALLNIGPFGGRFEYFSLFSGSPPAVTISMIISEFTMNLSRMYSHMNWASASQTVIAFLLYLTVGWWTARRTGSVKTGILAGLWAGLFYGLINFVMATMHFLQYMRSFSISGQESDTFRLQSYLIATTLIDVFSGFLFGFVVYGLLPGILGGITGGFLGRRFPMPTGPSLSRQGRP